MYFAVIAISLFIFSGCAKLSYITSQSVEQVRLVTAGKNIDAVIEDEKQIEVNRKKLIQIKKYKEYFSNYFNEKVEGIYEKVIFLDRPSVSYLVISSPWKKIKPIEECFLFVGCFPYLGFFSERGANEYQIEMENKGFSSHVRPVDAYSTLGHFNDRVLSSFFNYSEKGLANLIFHELVHSVIFFKNGVALNENLASFIADELVVQYFHENKKFQQNTKKKKIINRKISYLITEKIKKINKKLEKFNPEKVNPEKLSKVKLMGDKPSLEHLNEDKIRNNMEKLINDEFGEGFKRQLITICRNSRIEDKFCLKYYRKWTPSKLAAFGTYGNLQDDIEKYYRLNFQDLREFYNFLKSKYLDGEKAEDIIKIIKKEK